MGRSYKNQGVRPVTVPVTTAPASVVVITAPSRLVGWSLAAGNQAGGAKEGSVTSPAANAAIVSFGTIPAGEYTLNWQVELSGTLAAADANNFAVRQAGVTILNSVNEATANVFPQEPIQIVIPAGGATLTIVAVALATVGAVYSAQATLTSAVPAQAELFDSAQPLGMSSSPQGFSDTQYLGKHGIYVSTNITITVLNGTVSGVIYVCDSYDEVPFDIKVPEGGY